MLRATRANITTPALIVANLIAIVFILESGMGLREVLWIYWLQSVIIGYFNYKRLRRMENSSILGMGVNRGSMPGGVESQDFMAKFFALHYGGFHFFYGIFLFFQQSPFLYLFCMFMPQFAEMLCSELILFPTALLYALPIGAIFFFNHWLSFNYYEKQPKKDVNIAVVMMLPYARIIPMHIMIVLGAVFMESASGALMLLFLVMKTIADVVMHVIEHKVRD